MLVPQLLLVFGEAVETVVGWDLTDRGRSIPRGRKSIWPLGLGMLSVSCLPQVPTPLYLPHNDGLYFLEPWACILLATMKRLLLSVFSTLIINIYNFSFQSWLVSAFPHYPILLDNAIHGTDLYV